MHYQSLPISLPTPSHPQATPNLPSVFVLLPILDISCKWNHTIYGLCAWLFSLRIMFSRFIYIVACISSSLLLWLNPISLYGYITF